MVTNKYDVYIDNILYTHYCVMPLKGANLLDERLDEVYLSVRHIPVEVFQPLTPVKIVVHNKIHFNENVLTQGDYTLYFVVANDNNIVESPVGSGLYNHDIYLLETTKIAECTIVDSLTFTNDLGRNYAANPVPIVPDKVQNETYPPAVPESYVTPLLSGTSFTFVSVKTIYSQASVTGGSTAGFNIISPNGEQLYFNDNINQTYTTILAQGTYTVHYSISTEIPSGGEISASCDFVFTVVDNYYPLKKLTMKDVINRVLMLSKNLYQGETPEIVLDSAQEALFDKIYAPEMTFTQKTLRECLQDCGKIVHGEPRLTPIEGATTAPFYTLTYDLYGGIEGSNINVVPYVTKTVSQAITGYCTSIDSNAQNLVNQLDYINTSQGGGTLTEPYIDGYKTLRTETLYIRVTDTNGIIATQYPIYTVEKLMCGYIPPNGTQKDIDITPYLFEATEYNSQLSSYKAIFPFSKAYGLYYSQGQKNIYGLNFKVDGAVAPAFQDYAIVNILQKATGNNSLNISSDNFPVLAFQITYKPIYNVRVSQTKPFYTDYKRQADLIYNQQSNLMEAQYYGENLKGVVARLGTVEKTYTYMLSRWGLLPKAGQMFDDDYYISAVSWELLPNIIKVTLGLSKDFNRLSEYIGVSSNKRFYEVSERQAYDRNILYKEYMVFGDEVDADNDCLLGSAAVQGIMATFNQAVSLTPLSNVIAWGGTYNSPIYAKVDVSDKVNYTVITQGSSTTRCELEFQAQDYGSTAPIYIIGTLVVQGASGLVSIPVNFTFTSTRRFLATTPGQFNSFYYTTPPYYTGTTSPLPTIQLPVIASALGNSMVFSWKYADNYSAGPQVNYATNDQVSRYWQDDTPYCDYYGKMYYYNFLLQPKGVTPTNESEQAEIGQSLPNGSLVENNNYFSTLQYKPYIIRKDSREILQVNAQIECVTNQKNLIIGSALAACCPLIRGTDTTLNPKVYIFPDRLNKFINHVEGNINVDLSTLPQAGLVLMYDSQNNRIAISFTVPADGQAWGIVTNQTEKSVQVEDEQGEVVTQIQVKGGDILLAANGAITAGQTVTIYGTPKHKIFER